MKYVVPLLEQGFISGGNFLMSLIVVRFLSFESFSEFALVQMVALIFVSINQSLVVAPFQTLGPKEEVLDVRKVFHLQALLMVVMLIAMVVLGCVMLLMGYASLKLVVFGVLFSLSLVFQDFYRKLYYVVKKERLLLMVSFLAVFFQLSVVCSLHFLGLLNLNVLLGVLTIPGVVVLLFFVFKFRLGLPHKAVFLEYWFFGRWLFFNAMLQWFSGNLVITIGVFFLGSAVAGVVRLAQNIIGMIGLLFQVLENVVPPKVAHLFSVSGLKSVKRYLVKVTVQVGLVVALGVLVIVLFSEPIYLALYGPGAVGNAYMLKWFGPLLIASFMNIPLRHFFRTIGETKVLFHSYVVGVVLSVVSVLITISTLGVHSIGLSLVVGQVSMIFWFVVKILNRGNEVRSGSCSPG